METNTHVEVDLGFRTDGTLSDETLFAVPHRYTT